MPARGAFVREIPARFRTRNGTGLGDWLRNPAGYLINAGNARVRGQRRLVNHARPPLSSHRRSRRCPTSPLFHALVPYFNRRLFFDARRALQRTLDLSRRETEREGKRRIHRLAFIATRDSARLRSR